MCDTAKALAVHSDTIRYRYLNQYGANKNYSLVQIYKKTEFVSTEVSKQITNVTFHNIDQIEKLFTCLLEINISFSELKSVISTRHDLVHRNGFDIDGVAVKCNKIDVLAAIDVIQKAVERVQDRVTEAGLK